MSAGVWRLFIAEVVKFGVATRPDVNNLGKIAGKVVGVAASRKEEKQTAASRLLRECQRLCFLAMALNDTVEAGVF